MFSSALEKEIIIADLVPVEELNRYFYYLSLSIGRNLEPILISAEVLR